MKSKVFRVGLVSQLRDGLAALLGKSGKVTIEGKEVKLKDVLDVLDKLVAHAKAAAQARGAYRRTIAEQRAFVAQAGPLVLAVRAHLLGSYSEEQLAECGLAKRKTSRRLTAAERTAVTAKVRATRQAHGHVSVRRAREAAALAEVVATYGPHPGGSGEPTPATPGEPGPSPVPVSVAKH
jgi:hypothetical protein